MLAQTPGELWHEVEPTARARDGWVAFRPCPPCPTTMQMRSLMPSAADLSSLANSICTIEDALHILEVTVDAAYQLQSVSRIAHARSRAVSVQQHIAALQAALRTRYTPGRTIRVEDARRVADYVAHLDHTVQYQASTTGTRTIYSDELVSAFYRVVRDYLTHAPCKRPRLSRRWWLIPVLLIGTTLVVHSELKERRK